MAFGDVTLFRVAAVLSEGRHGGGGPIDGPDRPHPNPELDTCILQRDALAKELEILKSSDLTCHDPQMIVEIFGDAGCSYTRMVAHPFELTSNYATDLGKCLDLAKETDMSAIKTSHLMGIKVNGACSTINATKDLTALCLAASQNSIPTAKPEVTIQAFGSSDCKSYEITRPEEFRIFGSRKSTRSSVPDLPKRQRQPAITPTLLKLMEFAKIRKIPRSNQNSTPSACAFPRPMPPHNPNTSTIAE